MVVKQVREGRFWSVAIDERWKDVDAEVIFSKDKNRVVIKLQGATIVVENMSTKELNNE